MVDSVVDTWNERFSRSAAIERTIRRQHFLRGYELGRGGERLGPEEAVAFLEEHAEAAEADIQEATREEIHEMRQMILQVGTNEAAEENMRAIAQRMVQEALPNWKSAPVTHLLVVMLAQKKPELWGVRLGGRRGVAFAHQEPSTFWLKLLGAPKQTARVRVRWEDGTLSDLPMSETVEWCLMFFPAS